VTGFIGRAANFPARRGIFTGVTGRMGSAAPDNLPDAGLMHSALGGDVASLSTLLDGYRASLYVRWRTWAGRRTPRTRCRRRSCSH